MTTRAQYRSHVGRALGRNYYISSTTTAASANAFEVRDSARTEHDDFWNGTTLRINGQDVPLRGGAGVNTNRTPTLFTDQQLLSTPAVSTNYEVLKTWTFQDVDEAIDDSLSNMWPYYYDPIDDSTTVAETTAIEIPLPATWREIWQVERELINSSPTRYRVMLPIEYKIRDDPVNPLLLLNYVPFSGAKLRFQARAIPTLGSTDSATSVQPWQVLVPGALSYLYTKGANADMGSLSSLFARKAQEQQVAFARARARFAQHREARDRIYPVIAVG